MTFQVQISSKDQNWPKLTPQKKVAPIELYRMLSYFLLTRLNAVMFMQTARLGIF